MSKYHDDRTAASDPGGISLSTDKLNNFKSELSFFNRIFINFEYPPKMLDEHLKLGDSRAAIVLETKDKLIIAAYTDEIDCVVLLKFSMSFIKKYNLKIGDRLLTVNTYNYGDTLVKDLQNGPNSYKRYINFYPFIANFLSNDLQAIKKRIMAIDETEWNKATEMGKRKLSKKGLILRNGSPYRSNFVGQLNTEHL